MAQEVLDHVMVNWTTIMVAHGLSAK